MIFGLNRTLFLHSRSKVWSITVWLALLLDGSGEEMIFLNIISSPELPFKKGSSTIWQACKMYATLSAPDRPTKPHKLPSYNKQFTEFGNITACTMIDCEAFSYPFWSKQRLLVKILTPVSRARHCYTHTHVTHTHSDPPPHTNTLGTRTCIEKETKWQRDRQTESRRKRGRNRKGGKWRETDRQTNRQRQRRGETERDV